VATAVSLATWLTSLLLMPSATASATPFMASCRPCGMQLPWKSWLTAFRPRSLCWPIERCGPEDIRERSVEH
jgi:hypothetical protein